MQEDKNIKLLLQEHGVEETSLTFSNSVMEKITVASFLKQPKPLLNSFVLRLLKIVFLVVAMAAVLCIVFIPGYHFPPISFADINNSVYNQLCCFILVFWIVMLINIWWNKRWNIEREFTN